jgi:aspartate racemase
MHGKGLIGIVSGLGPLAGSDVLDKALAYASEIYGAVDDADYPDVVLFSHGIDTFDATGSIEDDFVDELVRVVQEIELHHPTVLGIACNTAHLRIDELRAQTHATVVNLIDATAEAASRFDRRYLLLSSSTTRRTHLYHRALEQRGVRFAEVDDAVQLEVDEVVHAVMGHAFDVAGTQIQDIVMDCGIEFDAIIAACTELPIAFDHSNVVRSIPIIDSNRVLAEALVDTYFAVPRREHTLAGADAGKDSR